MGGISTGGERSDEDLDRGSLSADGPESKFGSQATARLRLGFERSQHPMLIADDQRRWVTGNAPACDLLGIPREELPWRAMDDFTPPSELPRLQEQWEAFLRSGEAEGWYELYVPRRGSVAVEFSTIANVLPARHLSVFIPDDKPVSQGELLASSPWIPIAAKDRGRLKLTGREREIMTLVAAGGHSGDIAEGLFVSPETVKSHVHNAMDKLGAHTRAHAVAIALVTGQITWDT